MAGRTLNDKLLMWREARILWHDERGWPGGALALLRDVSDTRRRLAGQRLLPFDRTPEELAKLNGERYSPRRRRDASEG